MKKNWDNPREHAMPDGVRVPAEVRIGSVSGDAGDGVGADGGRDGYGVPAVYPACEFVFE